VPGANVTITGSWPNQTIAAAGGGGGGGDALVSQPLSQFAATTSAQLRGVMSDETGSGLLYFQGGALGTPSSATLSNATGLPLATGISGFGTGIATALGIAAGSAGAPVLLNGAGGTPSSLSLANATGLPVAAVTGLGTGVATALAVNVGSAGSPVVLGGALGTPLSATLTNATGLPLTTGVTGLLPVASGGTGTATPGLVAGAHVSISGTWPNQTISATGGGGGGGGGDALVSQPLSQFAATTSAQLAGVITDETGTGALVFANSPTLITPALGTPSSVTLSNATGLPLATGISGFGTGIATALGIATGSAGAPVLFNGAGGTPSSITLTNGTGLPVAAVTGLGTGVATALAVNTGSAGAPVLFNGAGGTPSSITLTNGTGLPVAAVTGLGTGIATALAVNVGSTGAPVLLDGAGGTPSGLTLTNATGLPLTTGVTGLLPVANGGTGTATPGLVQGANVTITGSWPNQTIAASGGGGGGGSTAYSTSKLITPFSGAVATGTANPASSIALIGFDLKRGGRVDELHFRVQTALAGSLFQAAVYSMAANGDPTGNPIGMTASMSGAAIANVFDALATPFNVSPNTPYFLAVNVNSGTALAFLGLAATNSYPWTICGPAIVPNNMGTNVCFNYTISQTFGTWPDLTGATFAVQSGASRAPMAFFKFGVLT